jgi:twitching motility protein PilU
MSSELLSQIDKILRLAVERTASDVFITAGMPPSIKVDGELYTLSEQALSEAHSRKLVLACMTQSQRDEFLARQECNFALVREGIGRFRASAFVQRGCVGIVLRRIIEKIPTLEELKLPPILKELAMLKRGLVIFVGATGAGKSTSLAAMLQHRNHNSRGHIVTIEDPIEFVHPHASCIVTQREVGVDTESFEISLRNTLRQAPDVILIGEVRSAETMSHAVTFAETGHLVLCTLHANNANQALDRIKSFFPDNQLSQVWMDLSLTLKALVAQQLLPHRSGSGRIAAVEVMLNTPLIADYIRKGEIHVIKELMGKSNELGMTTMDQALIAMYQRGQIRSEDAISSADSANDVRLAIKLHDRGDIAGASADRRLGILQEENRGQNI